MSKTGRVLAVVCCAGLLLAAFGPWFLMAKSAQRDWLHGQGGLALGSGKLSFLHWGWSAEPNESGFSFCGPTTDDYDGACLWPAMGKHEGVLCVEIPVWVIVATMAALRSVARRRCDVSAGLVNSHAMPSP